MRLEAVVKIVFLWVRLLRAFFYWELMHFREKKGESDHLEGLFPQEYPIAVFG